MEMGKCAEVMDHRALYLSSSYLQRSHRQLKQLWCASERPDMTPLLTTWCNKLLLARITFRDSVVRDKLNKLDEGAQPCPLRSRNVLGNRVATCP
ncbi:hypothetical protein JG687_00017589 [Phytophthora cactorum]|uniref:Uncharacterized protein n=1 Tax=Phytophthora cactorum TaxID=29920 RepID=A0A8T1TSV8_9STRA|nr:hypothetical protein JG687_00017589 [Phytophthora cactorum]